MLFNHERALRKMDQYGLDAIVAAVPRNVFYASGYWTRISEFGFQENHAAVIVPRDPDKPATLILPQFAVAALLEHPTWIPAVRPTEFLNMSLIANEPEPVRLDPLQGDVERLYEEKVVAPVADNPIIATCHALQDLGLASARVGFDDLRLAQHVQRDLASLQVRDAHDAWLDIRKVKTAKEVDLLRIGAKINQDAIQEILPMIRPGVVWKDIATHFRNYVAELGANLISSQKALQFGAEYGGEFFPDLMFESNDWKVFDGQCIIFETWGTYANYAFDCSRTVHIGDPPADYRRMCEIISAGQREVECHLKVGVSTHDIFVEARRVIDNMDVPTPRKTLLFLHSLGLDIIEQPSSYPAFGQIKSFELEENTVLNYEFLYFGHTLGPFHLESTYLLSDKGVECFHTLPQQLMVLAAGDSVAIA
jgi:Xaa-Pro aminopeptidase